MSKRPPNLKKTKDGIVYAEVAGIKFAIIGGIDDMYGVVPPFKLAKGNVSAIKTKSWEHQDIIEGIEKYKEDIFRYIFVSELRNELK